MHTRKIKLKIINHEDLKAMQYARSMSLEWLKLNEMDNSFKYNYEKRWHDQSLLAVHKY